MKCRHIYIEYNLINSEEGDKYYQKQTEELKEE